jgi:hypothetical protein
MSETSLETIERAEALFAETQGRLATVAISRIIAALDEARDAERDAVVAYLRQPCGVDDCSVPECVIARGLADEIERGTHRQPKETT